MNGGFDTLEDFKVDEAMHAILVRESGDKTFTMLPHTPAEIVGYANVKRSVSLAGQNVYEIGLRQLRRYHLGGPH